MKKTEHEIQKNVREMCIHLKKAVALAEIVYRRLGPEEEPVHRVATLENGQWVENKSGK